MHVGDDAGAAGEEHDDEILPLEPRCEEVHRGHWHRVVANERPIDDDGLASVLGLVPMMVLELPGGDEDRAGDK